MGYLVEIGTCILRKAFNRSLARRRIVEVGISILRKNILLRASVNEVENHEASHQ